MSIIDPEMPAILSGRAADNWRPLIAIADVTGGNYRFGPGVLPRRWVDAAASNRKASCCSKTSSRSVNRRGRPHSSRELAAKLAKMEERPQG